MQSIQASLFLVGLFIYIANSTIHMKRELKGRVIHDVAFLLSL